MSILKPNMTFTVTFTFFFSYILVAVSLCQSHGYSLFPSYWSLPLHECIHGYEVGCETKTLPFSDNLVTFSFAFWRIPINAVL